MTRILSEHIMTDQPDSLPTLSNIARSVLTGLRPPYEMLTAGLVFVERALVEIAPLVSRQRLVAAARRLGRDGKWEVAAGAPARGSRRQRLRRFRRYR